MLGTCRVPGPARRYGETGGALPLRGARLGGRGLLGGAESGAEHQNPFCRLCVLGGPPSWCGPSTIRIGPGQCFNLSDISAIFEGMTVGQGVIARCTAPVPRPRVAASHAQAEAFGNCRIPASLLMNISGARRAAPLDLVSKRRLQCLWRHRYGNADNRASDATPALSIHSFRETLASSARSVSCPSADRRHKSP